MILPTLTVPTFPRIDEYAGIWAMEPIAFRAHWDMISRVDIHAHMKQEQEPPKSQVEMMPAPGGTNIAFVPVLGTLMKQKSSFGGTSTIQLRRDIRTAANDPNVSAILLGIDSPGGTTAGLDDLAADVRAAKAQKPVWAHVDDLTASAAYWIASQTDAIYANSPTALVGSIGTLLTIYDQSVAAEQNGVKALVFATGPLKGAGVPGSRITEAQASYFQGIVDTVQKEFDAAVQQGRGLTNAQLAAVRTGGVFSAPEAKKLKLIDGIQPLGKTISMLGRAAAAPRKATGNVLPMLSQTRMLPTLERTLP